MADPLSRDAALNPRRTTHLIKGIATCRDSRSFWPRSSASLAFPAAVAEAARAATTTIRPSPTATAVHVPHVAAMAVAAAVAAVARATVAGMVNAVAISRAPRTLVPLNLRQAT